MKSIAVVTDGKNKLDTFLKNNLYEIFQGYAEINLYHFNKLKEGDKLKENVVLVMIKDRVLKAKDFVDDSKRIIVIDRTIKAKEVYKVFAIPDNMDVLVANDNYETTLQTVSLLYEIGINHLNLIPYDFKSNYENIKIAITPGESNFVPEHVDKIIDLGNRIIDISTFYKIVSLLEIKDKDIIDRILKYSDDLINIHSGIDEKLKELVIRNEHMDTLINLSKDGILLSSLEGKITTYNKKFLEILDLSNSQVKDANIKDIFENKLSFLVDKENVVDEVVNIKSKYLNINKKTLNYLGKKNGAYINIQEITYIRQLEQNLSKKLREKGQIARYELKDIITSSERMIKCKAFSKKIAKTELTVLITGESGTGKELLAQSIHNASDRNKQPFIAINCAAMPDNLLESELFGYESGAFTGANKEGKRGLFEQANNGTIFLDEIGDMPLHLQTKILRVLQERQVMRIGGESVIDIDVRVVAATNKCLRELIAEGRFRDDLYYRLNVLPIRIPSLRERKEDIILLLKHFMKRELEIRPSVTQVLENYNWNGNIRELKNVAAYIDTLCEGDNVTINDLPEYISVNCNNNYKVEIEALNNKKCYENAINVLKILNDNIKSGKGMGRNSLISILTQKNIYCSEGEMKKVLTLLDNLELISSSVGRGGSKISERGIAFLEYIQ
ncbi:sigma-54 interaction domain-containing protein [Oceanirhabdus sp. W0125-5]|uniref:sigma-54 interaction domain-containing protein n=1 Tax=Oceanirhabdus sp. W0125-5 TaxID=2999116 RepID=UPI0022F2FBC8|nr:sigma 54-interacting transcriptional regulator [Oceanirhabdus sp. W0125-5]WBW97712.1 sigma 54-interacting transcriptional regulator [Oceanirhabdus sp. W0125-5]